MKFSTSLLFNAVGEWQGSYIGFESLKATIYSLEKQAHASSSKVDDLESAALLLGPDGSTADKIFVRLLDKELQAIAAFYAEKEGELLSELELTMAEINRIEAQGFPDDADDDSDSDSDDGRGVVKRASKAMKGLLTQRKTTPRRRRRASSGVSSSSQPPRGEDGLLLMPERDLIIDDGEGLRTSADELASPEQPMVARKRSHRSSRATKGLSAFFTSESEGDAGPYGLSELDPGNVWSLQSEEAMNARIMVKLRLEHVFRELSQLKSYVLLNYTGFRKILKVSNARAHF